jgi:Flp pilus assembly protein protease CpaA
MIAVELFRVIAGTCLLVAAARYDILRRRVPNWIPYLMIGTGMLAMVAELVHGMLAHSDILWAWMLIVLFLTLWRLDVFGGGDAKVLMGLATLMPHFALRAADIPFPPTLLIWAMASGLVVLAAFAQTRIRPRPTRKPAFVPFITVSFGLAIIMFF